MDASSQRAPFDELCLRIASGRAASRLLSSWVSQFDLKEPEFRLLWLLREESTRLDQSQVAELMASSHAQVSALVERLRGGGYLSGSSAPGDRRRSLWSITPTGRALLQKIELHASGEMRCATPPFSPPRRAAA